MRVLPVNTDVLLVELDELSQAVALNQSLLDDPIAGVHELVPAARTVLVRFHPTRIDAAELTRLLLQRDVSAPLGADGEIVQVPVSYDGDDLVEVAGLLGVTPAEVIAMHTASTYTVAFTGFAPGFSYLVGGDPRLDVPRRSVPRTAIPAGAVGLAGTYSGVYPRVSPGGWQIIGTTELPMFDLRRDPPATLRPGMRVRFVDVTGKPDPHAAAPLTSAATGAESGSRHALEVVASGLGSTLQDLGRPGHADLGVSRSGALDHDSARLAARLVGNSSDAASIETHGGLRLRAIGEQVLAVTGARVSATIRPAPPSETAAPALPHREQGIRPVPDLQAFALRDGETLELGFPTHGSVAYVGVRGGFAVTPTLDSLSTDVLSGLGPAALSAGDVLPVRRASVGAVAQVWGADSTAGAPHRSLPAPGDVVTLDVVLGPRTEMFTDDAVQTLFAQQWDVTAQSNRVGLRLHGPTPLERRDHRELESEGTASGALQVPPNGQPVLFMADHPLTGGYPVIGSVASYHLNLAGQVPIGASIRFRTVTDPPQPASAVDDASFTKEN
ncbi:carboxyltransferase domain-containing protein [Pseudoclavibacter sp. 13-3]|uniref:5-oxoprolinase subunit B/C family protein n=1 Tax=Pseudoclavibacter sp. 13-3 TaxID=2901228 RepID=UPI001E5FB1B3|nr:carboxyltransferase domain-containing protein [Pseudoclavibacter sp. 13-3]MCD7101332.1 carboxyltransferase domain-containing protein [Pseudoclavibacter sp. 13-3]